MVVLVVSVPAGCVALQM